jgi:hypothetical protein
VWGSGTGGKIVYYFSRIGLVLQEPEFSAYLHRSIEIKKIVLFLLPQSPEKPLTRRLHGDQFFPDRKAIN